MSRALPIVTPLHAAPLASVMCAGMVSFATAGPYFWASRMSAMPPNADFAVEYEGSSS